MSIIIGQTQEQLTVNDYVIKIKEGNFQLYNLMKSQHAKLFNMIWSSVDFTPKEVIEAFGTDAATLFQLSGNIQSMLVSVDPNYVPLSPKFAYTINQDGTVTVDMNSPNQ